MHEQYIQLEMTQFWEAPELPPPRRLKVKKQEYTPVKAQLYDFSQIDFSRPEIARSLARAYRVLLESSKQQQHKAVNQNESRTESIEIENHYKVPERT